MRSTLYNVPNNQDVLKASGVPFAVSITPLAESLREEVMELHITRTVSMPFCLDR
jgi:hypothetical protein